ncbi:unnamed protein product [Aureobasidium vineae]|uniref:Endoglucanase EG-II n=1 Tax=Aureobasidium vineae TaxID=2773715 RepID=A0A9N8PIF3_9PEZI|nr:unnamed protein product [Aureobasidium vineae]
MKYSTFVVAAAAGSAAAASAPAYGQCGGNGWTGAVDCVAGYHCAAQNDWYSQCVPGAGSSSSAPAATKVVTSSKSAATSQAATTKVVTSSKPAATTSNAAASTGKVKYAGVNIAGFDFGMDTNGDSTGSYVDPGTTGQNQMNHFVKDDKLNTFRLPVGWQYLVNNQLGGNLDSTFFAKYDQQMTYCLNSGAALCILDLHNYARWNGQIVGSSGGPTNAQFASIWSQLATKPKVAFGLMNEPHDLQDINAWATTIQAAVTAIRKAGATQNMILLPGNDCDNFVDNGSAAALNKITNLDGSKSNLVFDVHQYSDSDNSGTHNTCVSSSSNIAGFSKLASWLRTNSRQAILTETGGSNDQSCLTAVCDILNYLMTNSDVYLGWTGWSAGMFATDYVLSEVPTGSAGSYTDQAIVSKCIAGVFNSK